MQRICSLIYLVDTTSDICYVMNTLNYFTVAPWMIHMVGYEACAQVLEVHDSLWHRYEGDDGLLLDVFCDLD